MDSNRFYNQLDRLDEILHVLRRCRNGLNSFEITQQLERHRVHYRTIRRDLQMLECMGRVECFVVGHTYYYRKIANLFATDAA